MQTRIEERGRKLHVTFGEGDDALEYIVPPVNALTGGGLVALYLGITSDLFGDSDAAMVDLLRGSLGWMPFKDPDAPTEKELAARALADDLYERAQLELRSEEAYFLGNVAMFWQTSGGYAAAQAFADDPTVGGGLSKALELLYGALGTANPLTPTSTGSSSESQTTSTDNPSTSTPQS